MGSGGPVPNKPLTALLVKHHYHRHKLPFKNQSFVSSVYFMVSRIARLVYQGAMVSGQRHTFLVPHVVGPGFVVFVCCRLSFVLAPPGSLWPFFFLSLYQSLIFSIVFLCSRFLSVSARLDTATPFGVDRGF